MKTANILIVEDELILAKNLARKLQRYGYNIVDIVNSGDKAINNVAEIKPDIILMDIVLKGNMDGITASKTIQTTYNIPIIYLSSYCDRETLKRARKTNPKGYLTKPYKLEDLQAIALRKNVRTVFEGSIYTFSDCFKLRQHLFHPSL